MPSSAGGSAQRAQERLKGRPALLAAEVPLDRIQTALYHFADYVRGHEINSAGPLRQRTGRAEYADDELAGVRSGFVTVSARG